jgi:uncharacterized protein YcfJ
MASRAGNPWKAATFALGGVMLGALATATVLELRGPRPEAPQVEPLLPVEEASPLFASAARYETEAQSDSVLAPPPEEPAPAPRRSTARRAPRNSEPLEMQPVAARPAAADIETCNRYASSTRSKARNAIEKGVIGGLVGAAVGAAGGAIADGGSGAGKGAGIGGIVGAAAGTAYGINQSNQADARAEAAYRECMQRRGYSSYASR